MQNFYYIWQNNFDNCKKYIKRINENNFCLKIIVFPKFFQKLLDFGIKESKLLSMYPVIDIHRFINLDIENGSDIMSG